MDSEVEGLTHCLKATCAAPLPVRHTDVMMSMSLALHLYLLLL
jgi:hypothetical protein